MRYNFSEGGYLSIGERVVIEEIENKYAKYIEKTIEFNKFAQNFQYGINVHVHSSREILAATLYASVLSTYQAALRLSFLGMMDQVKMLTRCMLEYSYPLIAISKDKEFAKKYIDSYELDRLSTINKLIEYHQKNDHDADFLTELRNTANKIKEAIKDKDIKNVRTVDCAIAAEMKDDYNTLYSFTSDYIHGSIKVLDQFLITNDDKTKLFEIKNDPTITGWSNEFVVLVRIVAYSVRAICVIFEMDEPEILVKITDEMDAMAIADNEEDVF